MSGFIYEKGADGIVTVTMDMPGQPVNTMNADFPGFLKETVDRLEQEEGLKGVILTSAKSTFFAGGDIKAMLAATADTKQYWYDYTLGLKADLRRLETLKVPVVAAINGAALGGGFEIALTCHRRIAVNHEKALIGLPEATLGLLPGAGGIIRMVRLLGFEKAAPLLLKGSTFQPEQARELGLVDALVADREALLAEARAWITANPGSVQPWRVKGHKIPGGIPKTSPAVMAQVQSYPAMLVKQYNGKVPPAPKAILAAAVESMQVDIDTAGIIESRYFTSLLLTSEAKERMTAFVEKRK